MLSAAYLNRAAVIRNASSRFSYDSDMIALLGKLNNKELKILQKNPDLVDKLYEISKVDETTAYLTLEEDFSLRMEAFPEQCWVSSAEIPGERSWVNSIHVGWAIDDEAELIELARDLLVRELQINLCMRWIEHKKKTAALSKHVSGYSNYV